MKKIFSTLLIILLSLSLAAQEKQRDVLRESALGGNPASQLKLANEYFTGTPERPQNLVLAAQWFKKVADQGYAEGMYNYSICLDQGLGVEADPYEAARYCKMAAEKGSVPEAIYNYAILLRKGVIPRNEKEKLKMPKNYSFPVNKEYAVELMVRLANQKFAPAQTELAEYYILDDNPENDAEAFRILTESASSANAPAKNFRLLADCYHGGIGTKKDPEKMEYNLRKSADAGDKIAIIKLAYCLEHGMDMKVNMKQAKFYYRKSAETGHPMGLYQFALLVEKGEYADVPKKECIRWYEQSAYLNYPPALFRLAQILEDGTDFQKRNPELAFRFYLEAAKKDYARAMYKTGCFYLQKEGPSGYDPTAAFYWFRNGAEKGDTPSMRGLAECYLTGSGCPVNRSEAVRWLKCAVREGDVIAERKLLDMQHR